MKDSRKCFFNISNVSLDCVSGKAQKKILNGSDQGKKRLKNSGKNKVKKI